MMYHAYQSHSDLMWPLRTAARLAAPMLLDPNFAAFGGYSGVIQSAGVCADMILREGYDAYLK